MVSAKEAKEQEAKDMRKHEIMEKPLPEILDEISVSIEIAEKAAADARAAAAEAKLAGEKAAEILDGVVTGYIGNLPENAIRHTLLLDGSGRIITDLQLYNCFDHFMTEY